MTKGTAARERDQILRLIQEWIGHERECTNISGAALLINLRSAIERGDHTTTPSITQPTQGE